MFNNYFIYVFCIFYLASIFKRDLFFPQHVINETIMKLFFHVLSNKLCLFIITFCFYVHKNMAGRL